MGQAPGSVALADLNGDGHLDIIVANEQGHNLTILLGEGTGRFTEAPGSPVPAGHMPNDIAVPISTATAPWTLRRRITKPTT